MLKILLGIVIGFGVISQSAFYSHLVLGAYGWFLPLLFTVGLGLCSYHMAIKNSFPKAQSILPSWPSLALLGAIALFISLEAAHYPLGGWDAWSSWNLKAKFIFLGQDRWKDMLDPVLWRSNTHYPLGLPCIIVWFWDILGQDHAWVPALCSIIFTVLGAAILLFSLQGITKDKFTPLILTSAVFLLPFHITLSSSQYSDILLGLYLLCAFVCLLSNEWILCGIFLGLLSFTKTEGMVAALLLGVLILFKHKKNAVPCVSAFILAALPAVIFQLFFAPKNEAFINGLISSTKHSDLARLQTILSFTFIELISLKWNGLWVLACAGIAMGRKKTLGKDLRIMGLFLMGYLTIVMGYYYVNTFFEIHWWISNTLNRILFSLAPSVMLWLGLSLL